MTRRLWLLVAPALCFAQQYRGPRPPKPDLPYLKHATNLIATEAVEAKEEKGKSDALFVIEGAASNARTPLAMPIFLMIADHLSPARLRIFRLDSKDGHREAAVSSNKVPIARMEISKLSSDNIYKIEVEDELEPGEYTLSLDGSNRAFCFQVF